MAGPRVRGNLIVTRVASALRVQQGFQQLEARTAVRSLTVGSPYENLIVDPAGSTPAQVLRLPQVSNNEDQAGIGTEFRITNNATSNVTIQTAAGGTIPSGTLTSTRTAIAICIALGTTPGTLDNGTWKIIILDAAASSGRQDPDVFSFNATTDWGTAVGTEYTFSVAAGSGTGQHSKSPNPHAVVYDGNNEVVFIETVVIPPNSGATSNTVEIKVNEVPDGRFPGRIEIY